MFISLNCSAKPTAAKSYGRSGAACQPAMPSFNPTSPECTANPLLYIQADNRHEQDQEILLSYRYPGIDVELPRSWLADALHNG